MKYLDPNRPQSGGFPLLLVDGKPCGAIPSVFLGPDHGQQPILSVLLPNSLNELRRYYAVVSDLDKFWLSWMEDPEQTLELLFGWHYYVTQDEISARAKGPVAQSLSDLGLD